MAPYSRNGLQTAHSKTGPGGRKLKLAETCAILSLVQLVMPGLAFAAELNLGSSDPHFTVDQNHQGSVNLTVNGESKTVGAGSALTAAEYATFLNISHGLEQTLTIGAGGVATGGTLTLTPQLAGNITGLTVPTNVSVVHDFATGVPFNLAGNFNNSGEFYAVSTSQAVTNAVIGAANFTNNTGALLTSVLPHTGLAGITGAISNLSLTLNVLNNLTNMGAITSAGNLNINAGAIYNQLPVGVAGVSPIMQAVNNLNLNATLGSITNSGILAATTGNINLASLNNLVVNNVNGSIQALAGTINIRNTNFDVLRDLNINLTGGNWLSQQLNIDAGCGTLEAEVREITGQVNVNAAAANLGAATQNLNLGTINITGDPTWFNTAGNVLISGPITATGVSPNIAILASGHIVAVTGATVIDSSTAQTGGNGGTLTLVAGANFFFGTGSGTNDTGTNLVIDSPSGAASGGGIYLDGTAPVGFVGTPAAITGMTSAGTGGNNSGGDIALVAYAGTSAGSGVVRLPSAVTVTSGGAGLGTNGSITMLAGATSGTAISAGGLQTSGSQLTAGSITLAAATPTINGSGTVSIIGGAIQAGSGTFVAGTLQNAAVSVGNLVAAGAGGSGSTVVSPVVSGGAGGNISIASKSNITTGALRVFGGGAGGGTISPGAGGSGGSIMLSTLQDITISGDVNASGGGGGAGLSGNFGSGGKGGSINITSIGALSISGPILAAGGGAGGTNTSAAGAGGGGGSFGGGGGAGISQGGGGGGGGGYYGGGGAGGELNGAPSGGGGYSGGGGGGGGGGGLAPGMFGGGGGGGGGLGIGGGGGGGQGVSSTAGGAGGAGGTAGTAGTKAGGTPGIGGAGFGGGGAGAASSSTTPGGSGGKGGTGGTAGPGVGTGGAPTGGSGGMFGMGGTAGGAIGAPTNGGDAGTSGAGGNIVLSGQRVTLTGTIGTASANWAGFATSVYAGDTVNALGAGGSITITSRGGTISPTYFADGNYASGATAVPITITSSNSLTSTGGMQAPSITFSGAAQTSPVSGGSFAGLAEIGIIEGDFVVNVTNFLAVTPAELIALIQAGSSAQTLVLSQSAPSLFPGLGFASGGNFTIAPANIPGTFTSLNLPANVTATVTAPALSYSGTALINGSLNFPTGGTLTVNGSVTGSGSAGATSGTFSLVSQTGNIGAIGTPFNIGVGAGTNISLQAVSGSITVGNLLTAGAGGNGDSTGFGAQNGGNGGAVTIQAAGPVSTSSIRTFGGGGGGNMSSFSSGAGGTGGAVSLSSLSSISVTGDINSSGGGGGGNVAGSSPGGAAGNVTLVAGTLLTVSGPILAAGGGNGANSLAISAGGGGSFGGGGGASVSDSLRAPAGGGGFYGGGGAGGVGNGMGGTGGGGGFASGGGGGGGSGGAAANPGAAGGGGGGLGQGGGGAASLGGSSGSGGGDATTNGQPGSAAGMNVGLQAPGGIASQGGGTGGAGSIQPGAAGGAGGAGSSTGGGNGAAGGSGPTAGFSGGAFGVGGQGATNGSDVGSGAGGVVSINAAAISLTGTIGAASTNWPGFPSSVYAGDTINTLGTGGTISITTTASDFVSSNVAGNIRAGSTVHLQANNIGSSLLPAGAVTVISPNISAVAASFANINNTFSLSGPGTGTVTIVGNPTTTNSSAGTTFVLTVPNALMLTSSAPLTAQNVTLTTGQPNASIIAGSSATGTATVALASPTVGTTVGATINGGSVTIANTHLSSLTISNAGTITASTGSLTASSPTSTNLNVTGGGTMNALLGGITLTATTLGATANSITFNGSQTFNGTTTLNATGPNQSVFVTAPAVVTGNNVLLLNTPFLNNQGKITGNPLILFSAAPGGGTIANSAGNIDLNSIGNLTFVGQSLAILASGSIVNSGGARTINLSTANTAPAGVLTMVAGYNFMPPTAGVVGPTATPFTLTTVGSGNVNLPTVSINTSSTAGSAGGVLVVANGFVSLGNITATAPSGLGGPVTIIGTGITTGSITTTGALGGAITLNSATPNMVTPVTVTNGIVTAGSFAPAVFGGNLILGTLNSGSGNITIATGSNGFYILGGTPNTSAVLSVMTGTTDINLFAFNAARVQLNTAANANIFSANAVGLNASTVAGNLSLTALGLLTVAGNVNAANVSLTTSGFNSGITVNSAITATAGSTPTITLSATGSVQLNGGLTANRVNVTTTGGAANNFVLNADITGVGANSQVSLNSFTGPNLTRTFGTIAAGTVGFSFAGAVGTNANRIVTNAGTLNLVNGGPANNVFITQQNSVTLGSSGFVSAGGTLNVIVQNGNLTFQSMFAGQNISLLAQNGGVVQTVGGFVSNATGGIFVTAGGGALSLNGGFFAGGTGAGAFSAATGTSTIGPVTVNNGALTIDAINGGVSQQNFTTLSTNTGNITIITRNGDALLNGFVRSNVNGGISITANMGNITFRGLSSAQANDVNVTTSGQGSILALPNSVSSSGMNGFFRLTAKGATGDITLSDAMISTTGVGSINLLADRNIVLGRMSSQNGSVTGTAGIVGGGSVTTGGVFSLLTTVTGSIIFTQNGAAGQISLGGDAYTFVDGGISLTAAGAGGITSRTLSAGGNGSVQLTANTTAGASYTAQPFSYIFTNTGNVGVGVAQNVSLQSVMAGGTVSIQAGNGTLSNAGLISGKSVNLQSGSSATLNGMVRSNNGAVNIQTGGALIVNQSLTSSNGALNIQVNSGSFTTGQSALLAAIGGSMNISTLAPASGSVLLNGGANVLGTGNLALNITSARDLTAGQLFNVTTGNINLTANVGTLQVNNSVIGRSDITILHKGIAAQDRIVLGANASVQALAPSAPQGNVVIAITNGPVTNVAGMVPTGGTVTQITSGGGQIFFGPGQFVNTGFTTLNAKGANVTFFRDAAAVDGVNAIQLNSNFIFADPPVPGAVLLPGAVQAAPFLHTGVGGVVPGALNIDSNSQANMVAPTTNVIVPAALLAPTDSTMPSTRVLWSGAGVRYDEISSPGTAANAAAATAPGSATVRFTAGVGSTTGRSVAGSSGASPACSVVDSGPGCPDSGEQTSNGAMGEGKPSGAVLPVGVFNSVLTGFVAKKAGILAGKPSYMKAASEASVKQISDSAFKLDNGEVVVSASRRSTLYSGDYAIEIAPGAIVHATRYGSVLKIRNLCDTAGNAVRLTISDSKVSLSPGEELVVGPDLAAAEAAVKSDNVGRRNTRRYVIDSKRAIVKTELSIIALIQRNSLLLNMYTKGSAADHNVMDRVMKMAAALFQVTGRRGAYSAYEPTKENHPIALRSSQPQG